MRPRSKHEQDIILDHQFLNHVCRAPINQRERFRIHEAAARQHVALPRGLSANDKALKASLEALSEDDFDRAYMKDMVKDHRTDVAEFEKQSKSAYDPAVKSFAMQTLPTLREHLKEAQRIAATSQSARNAGQ